MSAAYPQTVCVRVREQVSLELDGELSQLEHRMLDTHLERCPRCAAYADDVRQFTERMRSAPPALMQRPVVVRKRRPLTTVRLQVGIAAAFALAALGLGTQLASSTGSESGSLARFEGQPSLSPPRSVDEREQAILRVVRVGRPLPEPGSVI
jgi:anti-sigma factor RsiW